MFNVNGILARLKVMSSPDYACMCNSYVVAQIAQDAQNIIEELVKEIKDCATSVIPPSKKIDVDNPIGQLWTIIDEHNRIKNANCDLHDLLDALKDRLKLSHEEIEKIFEKDVLANRKVWLSPLKNIKRKE